MDVCRPSNVSGFNVLSRFVIGFFFQLKEQASFNFIAAVTVHIDFGGQENKIYHYFHCVPIYLPWSDVTRHHDFSFLDVEFFFFWCWVLSQLFLSFTSIKRIFSSSSLSAIKWVAQSCPTLWDPMNGSLPGSSVHGIFQPRVLEWVALSFSMRSSQPRDQTRVSYIAGRHFTIWATREALLPSG